MTSSKIQPANSRFYMADTPLIMERIEDITSWLEKQMATYAAMTENMAAGYWFPSLRDKHTGKPERSNVVSQIILSTARDCGKERLSKAQLERYLTDYFELVESPNYDSTADACVYITEATADAIGVLVAEFSRLLPDVEWYSRRNRKAPRYRMVIGIAIQHVWERIQEA